MPGNKDLFVSDLVRDPEVAHFHCAGSLPFDSVIGYANGGAVVAVNGCGWLGMAHFNWSSTEDFSGLAVDIEGTGFSFSSGGHDGNGGSPMWIFLHLNEVLVWMAAWVAASADES